MHPGQETTDGSKQAEKAKVAKSHGNYTSRLVHTLSKKFPGHSLKRPVEGILCTTVHPAIWRQYGGNGLAHTFEDPWEVL